MLKNSYVRIYKLTDVKGKADYISNPDRQEHLYATYATVEPVFWSYLADQSQHDFWKYHQGGKCIEAREFVIALPKSFVKYEPEALLQLFVELFRVKHPGIHCTAALHHNKTETNYHIHLIFSERTLLEQKEVKRAERNMYYNEDGRHVKTKKEVLDENKQLRKGCTMIPKGEIYEMNYFSAKDKKYKSDRFTEESKQFFTDLINQFITDEKEKLTVFNANGVYLPTKKIGKNNPKEAEIKADNEARQNWNRRVDEALVTGIPESEIMKFKKTNIQKQITESIQEKGNRPELLKEILMNAVSLLIIQIRAWMIPKKPVLKIDMKVFQEMQNVKASLDNILRDLRRIENVISVKQEKLDAITGIWKGKEKAALLKEIAELVIKRDDKSLQLDRMVRIAGYKNVQSFMTALKKSEKLIEEYLKDNPDGMEGLQNENAKSVIDTIHKYQDEAKIKHRKIQNKQNRSRLEID